MQKKVTMNALSQKGGWNSKREFKQKREKELTRS